MFQIKICGVSQPMDIGAIKMSGADAIGLNFYRPSVRYVDPDSPQTRQLSRLASEAGLFRVGVFVNEPAETIEQVAGSVGLDAIQLHGDEPIETAGQLRSMLNLGLIRAIKLPLGRLSPATISEKTGGWIEAGWHLLMDADAGAAHGGSGQSLHWRSLGVWAEQNPDVGWTLAGGLTPENVAQAIEESAAASVDTASGVEELRGVKSQWLIRRFVVEARAALDG